MKKNMISKTEVILRCIIIMIVFLLAYYTEDADRQVISVIGFLAAFIGTLYMHRHFFPFTVLAIFCYLSASTQELWNADYAYVPITKFLWSAGNIFLPLGVISFIYQIIFKYKIVENGPEEKQGDK